MPVYTKCKHRCNRKNRHRLAHLTEVCYSNRPNRNSLYKPDNWEWMERRHLHFLLFPRGSSWYRSMRRWADWVSCRFGSCWLWSWRHTDIRFGLCDSLACSTGTAGCWRRSCNFCRLPDCFRLNKSRSIIRIVAECRSIARSMCPCIVRRYWGLFNYRLNSRQSTQNTSPQLDSSCSPISTVGTRCCLTTSRWDSCSPDIIPTNNQSWKSSK